VQDLNSLPGDIQEHQMNSSLCPQPTWMGGNEAVGMGPYSEFLVDATGESQPALEDQEGVSQLENKPSQK
jgi:hypothetical protein